MTITRPRKMSYREAIGELVHAQKTSKGAPAYSRFVNRPLGRRFAAAAYRLNATPNQVTGVSAAFTFSGLAMVALADPNWVSAIAVALLLVVGYGLDAADGQLSRLQGSGSAAGEWLDHVVDAVKMGSLHLVVLICWYRFFDLDTWWLLVPLAFQVVAATQFFAVILTDQLRRMHRADPGTIRAGQGSSSGWYSLAVIPTDYGLMCLVFALLGWNTGFVLVYTLLLLANTAFLALALPKWFREVNLLG
jgi:Phosphatidylglycerophosphate synthase